MWNWADVLLIAVLAAGAPVSALAILRTYATSRDGGDAKRFNEQLKSSATFLNGIGIAVAASGFVLPVVGARAVGLDSLLWALCGTLLHLSGLIVLSAQRSEK